MVVQLLDLQRGLVFLREDFQDLPWREIRDVQTVAY